MEQIRLYFRTDPQLKEALLAVLSELPLIAFEETDDGWVSGIEATAWTNSLRRRIHKLKAIVPFLLEEERLVAKNWNEIWAQNFEPIQFDNFAAVRAPFHEHIRDVQFEIVIQPQMAFGTGHHETTQLMIQQLARISVENKMVLDYGCGTGILAILAEKMGAVSVDALEVDPMAYQNLLENLEANKSDNIHPVQGDLDCLRDNWYDLVVANLTRNLIIDSAGLLRRMIHTDGYLIASGFLKRDLTLVVDHVLKVGGNLIRKEEKKGWCAATFQF